VANCCEYGALQRGISSLAEELLAPQERLRSMELHTAFSAVLILVRH
jgi:hypothetical protein